MDYLRDIEDFAREWNLVRVEFCRRFERNRAEVLKEGVMVYHGNGDQAQQEDMFGAQDLTAWCAERLWSYRKCITGDK